MHRLLIPAILFALTACSSPADSGERSSGTGLLLDENRYVHYGAGVHDGALVGVDEVLDDPTPHIGKPMRVRGVIISVCQSKGCWVRVGSEESNMLVQFKDYGFFLPTDASGSIVLEGEVSSVSEESIAERKHFLEDAGKQEEAARVTEPVKSVRFVASGAAIDKQQPNTVPTGKRE